MSATTRSQRNTPPLLDQLTQARATVVHVAELVAASPNADRWMCERLACNAAQVIAALEVEVRKSTRQPELIP